MNIEDFLDSNSKVSDSYRDFIKTKYNQFIKSSEIPLAYMCDINEKTLSKNLRILHRDIKEIIDCKYSLMLIGMDYMMVNYYMGLLLDKYFQDNLDSGLYLEQILCVDTKLLLDDYLKNIGDSNSDVSVHYNYDPYILFNVVETAPYVIWNRFNDTLSDYKKNKFLNIIDTRKRQGLGNMYFTSESISEFKSNAINVELHKILQPDIVLDCCNERIELL